MIEQLAQFTGVRAAETFVEPLQLHLQASDLLEQFRLLGQPISLPLLFLPRVNSSLAPSRSCRFHWLTKIGSHREVRCLTQFDSVVGGDLLDRLAATDRLHGDPVLELGAVGAALAQLLRRRLRQRWERLSWWCPASEVNDGACPEKQSTSRPTGSSSRYSQSAHPRKRRASVSGYQAAVRLSKDPAAGNAQEPLKSECGGSPLKSNSWQIADYYAVRDWGSSSLPIEDRNSPYYGQASTPETLELGQSSLKSVHSCSLLTNCNFELSSRARCPEGLLRSPNALSHS